jgi:GNAT superfamily N-acetyltransferase
MDVERLGPDDWQEYREIRLTALGDAPTAFAATLDGERDFPEARWRQRLSDSPLFVIRDGGRAAAMAGAYDRNGGAHLISMWVSPALRGRGASDSLIAAVTGWAREQGYRRITLWVTIGNEPAERLYERHGFRPTGAVQPVHPGEPDLMERELALNLADQPAGETPRP